MAHKGKICRPLIILITDNENSLFNCNEQIENLNSNGWFKTSTCLVYFWGNERDLAIQNIGSRKFVSSTEGLLFNESDLQNMIWYMRPKTLGEKNIFARNISHGMMKEFVEEDFSYLGGFGDFDGDFGGFDDGEWSI